METTEVYKLVTKDLKKINLLRGGARSSKSYSLEQISLKWLWTGYIGDRLIETGEALILRETMPALRRTILKEFITMLHDTGIMPYIEWKKSFNEFKYQGRQISFFSLDEESKVLGIQSAWFWINEGNPVSYNIFNQLLIRCENFCFLDYNPFDPSGWINQQLELKRLPLRGDVSLTVSTYKMNPYLPKTIIEEIEGLAMTDPQLFQVYNKGEWAELTGLIYHGFKEVDYAIEGKTVIGLDFGYSDPMALIEITLNAKTKELLVKELYYEREKTIDDLIQFINEKGYNTRDYLYIADSADPEKIERIKRAGIRIKKARKGKSSIRNGIDTVKQYSILVYSDDDNSSDNIISELHKYKWKEDREGESLEEPIDKFNHALDAIRYGTDYLHKKRGGFKIL
jgi:phage terminase large subunit